MTMRDYRIRAEKVLSPRPEGLRIKPETNIWQEAKEAKKQRKQGSEAAKQSFQAQ